VKYAWIDAQRADYPLPAMCQLLSVSVSGYRAWLRGGARSPERLSDIQLIVLMKAVHVEVDANYGSRRMHRELHARGHRVGLNRVERLMREQGIKPHYARRFRTTTNSDHSLPVAPNRLERDFKPQAPNRVWTSDITYIETGEGWLYLTIVLDLFNREVVGWSIKSQMTADTVTNALTMAWSRRKPQVGLIFHSDRGSQYASRAVRAKLDEYGMLASMSRKGDCWDNAPSESFFASLKKERVYATRYDTRDDATADLFDYVEVFYNHRRRHSTLGYSSPTQFLASWTSQQNAQPSRAA
jgi:putative transposase